MHASYAPVLIRSRIADGVLALNGLISEHAARGACVLLTSHQALSLTTPLPLQLDLEAFSPRAAVA